MCVRMDGGDVVASFLFFFSCLLKSVHLTETQLRSAGCGLRREKIFVQNRAMSGGVGMKRQKKAEPDPRALRPFLPNESSFDFVVLFR